MHVIDEDVVEGRVLRMKRLLGEDLLGEQEEMEK